MKTKTCLLLSLLLVCAFLQTLNMVPPAKGAILTSTITIISTTSDGYISQSGWDYNSIWAATSGDGMLTSYLYIGQHYIEGDYGITRSVVYFNTSVIPDTAIITSAALQLHIYADYSYTDFNITLQNGQPTYPRDPPQLTDYNKNYYSGNGGSRSTSTMGVGAYNITVTSLSWINVYGMTKLMLRSSRDINGNAPSTQEEIFAYAAESGEYTAPKLHITYEYISDAYVFTFRGPYNETSGLSLNQNVTVTPYITETAYAPPFTFNGIYVYNTGFLVEHFTMTFADNTTREYWIDPRESNASTIYVFYGQFSTYTINFVDLASILDEYPFVQLRRYVNGTLYTVEKRKVDSTDTIMANLIYGQNYFVYLGNEYATYIYGSITMTAMANIQLILRPVDFPVNSLNIQDTIRVYIVRNASEITVNYNDVSGLTTKVKIYFFYANETNAYTYVLTPDATFSFIWTNANAYTDYIVRIYITHKQFGAQTVIQYLSGTPINKPNAPPLSFDFMGNWGFDSAVILPVLLILCVAGCFSKLNAEVGAVLACILAILLTALGWINIPAGMLVTATFLSILFALVTLKRRG